MRRHPKGRAFVISDFLEIANYETVKKALTRLCAEDAVRRLGRGVYELAPLHSFFKQAAQPSTEEFALATARNFHWTIAPCGAHALFLLGLGEPAAKTYASTGPYRTYTFGAEKIQFLHRAAKELIGLSPKSALLVSALREIGQQNLDEETIGRLRATLNPEEQLTLLKDTVSCPKWMAPFIRRIAASEQKQR